MPVRELPSLTAHILSAWLSDQGLPISAGTLGDSAHRFVPLFEPVAEAILAHQNEAAVRHGDETPWRIQSLRETSRSSRAWLWTSVSEDAVYFHLVIEDAALAFTADLGDQVGDEHRLPHPRVPETMVCWVSVLSGYRERQFGLWVQRANLSRRAVGSACPFRKRLISGDCPGEELLLVAQTDGFNASGKAPGASYLGAGSGRSTSAPPTIGAGRCLRPRRPWRACSMSWSAVHRARSLRGIPPPRDICASSFARHRRAPARRSPRRFRREPGLGPQ